MDDVSDFPVKEGKEPNNGSDCDAREGEGHLLESERRVGELELWKAELTQSVRHLITATGTVLSRKWVPGDMDEVVKAMLVRVDTQGISPEIVEECAHRLAGHLEVKGVRPSEGPSGARSFKEEGFTRFLDEVAKLKGTRYVDDSHNLANLIAIDAALNVFMPLLSGFLLRLVGDTRSERQEISVKLSAIIRSLLNVEKQFRDFLDKSLSFLGVDNRDFSKTLSVHLDQIHDAVTNSANLEHENLIGIINQEIDLISDTIRQKNDEDEKLLSLLSAERVNLKSNLADVTRDYSNFVKHSTQLLKELEIIKAVALRDALTGVYNRRAYDEQLFLTLINYKGGKLATFSLIIFDIDFFRNVNNHHGHQAGDAILTGLAKVLVNTLRSDDFIFRYGGDEFVVLLPNSTLDAGAKVAEKLRSSVEAHRFPLSKGGEETLSITISLGVSQVRLEDSAESVLARADSALYASKASGRNRVSTEDPLAATPKA
jgi:diguanylate cyclase (GGDEF)-like protein